MRPTSLVFLTLCCSIAACARTGKAGLAIGEGKAALLTTVTGFSGPEAVRYDPDQDVYFVSNFNGDGDAKDNNGFISRVTPEGVIASLKFIAGGQNGVTLHAPRGMFIVGDTLWVADADAVRGFHRVTGANLAMYDFGNREVGFLNDVAADENGDLYVTDTGKDRIFRLHSGAIDTVMTDSLLGGPNGITWDRWARRFIVVSYFRGLAVRSFRPGSSALTMVGVNDSGQMDGVEMLAPEQVLIASQADSSIHLVTPSENRVIARTGGEPADIGIDTKRRRVAVPFVSRNAVEIWSLPR